MVTFTKQVGAYKILDTVNIHGLNSEGTNAVKLMTHPTPQVDTVTYILSSLRIEDIKGALFIERSGSVFPSNYHESGQPKSFNLKITLRHTCPPQQCLNELVLKIDRLLCGACDLKTNVYTGDLIWVWGQSSYISKCERSCELMQSRDNARSMPYEVTTDAFFESTCHLHFERIFVLNQVGKFTYSSVANYSEYERTKEGLIRPVNLDENDTTERKAKVTKRFGTDFNCTSRYDTAFTLPYEYFTVHQQKGYKSKLHYNGWTLGGQVIEDYYYWVNEFEATHPLYGRVWGDFEKEVYADSEEGFADFYANFPPESWDYGDI